MADQLAGMASYGDPIVAGEAWAVCLAGTARTEWADDQGDRRCKAKEPTCPRGHTRERPRSLAGWEPDHTGVRSLVFQPWDVVRVVGFDHVLPASPYQGGFGHVPLASPSQEEFAHVLPASPSQGEFVRARLAAIGVSQGVVSDQAVLDRPASASASAAARIMARGLDLGLVQAAPAALEAVPPPPPTHPKSPTTRHSDQAFLLALMREGSAEDVTATTETETETARSAWSFA